MLFLVLSIAVAMACAHFWQLEDAEKLELLVPRRLLASFATDAHNALQAAMAQVDKECNCTSVTALYGGAAVYLYSGGGPRTLDVDTFTGFEQPPQSTACVAIRAFPALNGTLATHPFPRAVGRWVRLFGLGSGRFALLFRLGVEEHEFFRIRMETTLRSGQVLHVFEALFNSLGTDHLRLARTPGGLTATHPQMLFFHALKLSVTKPRKGGKRLAYARAMAAVLDASPEYDRVSKLVDYEDGELHEGKLTRFTLDFEQLVRAGMTWQQARAAMLARVSRHAILAA